MPQNRSTDYRESAGEHTAEAHPGADVNLIALGIGAIIGAGLFVAHRRRDRGTPGPPSVLSFMVAGIGCAFAGMCYTEFATMIPIAGSAYTYAYATMGELVAWIIGWDLVLEYAVGAATVAIAWSEYFNKILEYVRHARSRTSGATRRSRSANGVTAS